MLLLQLVKSGIFSFYNHNSHSPYDRCVFVLHTTCYFCDSRISKVE